MTEQAERLYREALALSVSERVDLATRLLGASPDESLPEGEDLIALQALIDAGYRDLERGELHSATSVIAELEAI